MTNTLLPNSIEDISENPKKYGLPTFEEYKKNRSKYVKSEDGVLTMLDNSSTSLRNQIEGQVYYLESYRCIDIYELIRVCNSEGVDLEKAKIEIQLIESSPGKYTPAVIVRKNLLQMDKLLLP